MIVILTSSEDVTADYLCSKVSGAECVRLNTDRLLGHATFEFDESGFRLGINSIEILPEQVSGLLYRRPSPLVSIERLNTEFEFSLNEWHELFEGWLAMIPKQRWISHPGNILRANHKVEQLFRAKAMGFKVPETIATSSFDRVLSFCKKSKSGIIAKPLYSGYLQRENPSEDTVIYTTALTEDDLRQYEMSLRSCPTLFQERIDKHYDVRVTVVDNEIFAVRMEAMDEGHQRLDIRRDNFAGVHHTPIECPDHIRSTINTFVRSYGIRFGALDFVIDHWDQWYFLELNPNGQWAWMDQLGVSDISSALLNSLKNDRN